VCLPQQVGNAFRRMLAVGIKGDRIVGPELPRGLDSPQQGSALALVRRQTDDLDVEVFQRFAGSVRGTVVDHDDPRDVLCGPLHDIGDRLPFVEDRDDGRDAPARNI
jgi:hypothetical protein